MGDIESPAMRRGAARESVVVRIVSHRRRLRRLGRLRACRTSL
jgi:hypothetical protein